MSLTNILISWSKSPQYVSNGRERGRGGKRERGGEGRMKGGRPKREKVTGKGGRERKKKRKAERKRMGRDGECMKGSE